MILRMCKIITVSLEMMSCCCVFCLLAAVSDVVHFVVRHTHFAADTIQQYRCAVLGRQLVSLENYRSPTYMHALFRCQHDILARAIARAAFTWTADASVVQQDLFYRQFKLSSIEVQLQEHSCQHLGIVPLSTCPPAELGIRQLQLSP